MRPLSPRRPITERVGTRQPWQRVFSEIEAKLLNFICLNISQGHVIFQSQLPRDFIILTCLKC